MAAAAAAAAVSGAKRNLRAELKQRLRAISAEERLRQSRLLTQKVIAHSQYQKSKRISIFLSMQDEIDTEEIIKDIFQQGKTCFIPRYQFRSNHMDMVKLDSPEEITSLPKTSWNIHQPGEGEAREEALSTGGLDLIFMPGLGFDKQGNRLGRGRGYYDAYLKRCMQQPVKPYTMALAFREQICPQVPVDEHDMKFKLNIYEELCSNSESEREDGEAIGRGHGVTKSCRGPGRSLQAGPGFFRARWSRFQENNQELPELAPPRFRPHV